MSNEWIIYFKRFRSEVYYIASKKDIVYVIIVSEVYRDNDDDNIIIDRKTYTTY